MHKLEEPRENSGLRRRITECERPFSAFWNWIEQKSHRTATCDQHSDRLFSQPARSPSDQELLNISKQPRVGRKTQWTRTDLIALATLIVALVGLPAIYLAIPSFGDYVRSRISKLRPENDGAMAAPKGLVPELHGAHSADEARAHDLPAVGPATLYIKSRVLPVRVFLDGNPITMLTQSSPSITLSMSTGSHQVSVQKGGFQQDATVTLLPGGPPQILLIDRSQNLKGDTSRP